MFKCLPDYIIPVLDVLEGAGFEAYLVGGCVRDKALGKAPNDYDITTNAKPHEMISVFEGYRVIETGLKHGTLTVVSEGECVEITTYRVDGEYADNRHPTSVSFTDDITLDLSRRDFTVNAMAYSRCLGLCDPFHGMDDLMKKNIVCVGAPEDRFNEDGLRILRALRFASVLDFSIDEPTSRAVHSMRDLLFSISKERIYTEIKKLLCGNGVVNILKMFPDVISICIDGISNDAVINSADSIAKLPCDPIIRLAYLVKLSADALGISSKEHAVCLTKRLKASTADVKRTSTLAELIDTAYPYDDISIKHMMGKVERDNILAYAALRQVYTADTASAELFLASYEDVYSKHPCVRISDLSVGGNDVISVTGRKGAQIGKTLEYLLEEVITGRVSNTRESLIEVLQSIAE